MPVVSFAAVKHQPIAHRGERLDGVWEKLREQGLRAKVALLSVGTFAPLNHLGPGELIIEETSLVLVRNARSIRRTSSVRARLSIPRSRSIRLDAPTSMNRERWGCSSRARAATIATMSRSREPWFLAEPILSDCPDIEATIRTRSDGALSWINRGYGHSAPSPPKPASGACSGPPPSLPGARDPQEIAG